MTIATEKMILWMMDVVHALLNAPENSAGMIIAEELARLGALMGSIVTMVFANQIAPASHQIIAIMYLLREQELMTGLLEMR